MEAVRSYLNNMFSNMPATSEVQRAKDELMQMMEDKYTELRNEGKTENEAVGAVISEFGNLDELGPQLGIGSQVDASKAPENQIALDSQQVDQYLGDIKEASKRIGFAIAVCIMAVMPLMLLSGLGILFGIAEKVSIAIGVGILMLLVAYGVYLLINYGLKTEKYEDLEKKPVSLTEIVAADIKNRFEAFHPKFAKAIATGVLLIILGAALVAVVGVLSPDESPYIFLAIALLLILVALAVSMMVRAGMEQEAYEKLLNIGDYAPQKRKGNEVMERFSGIYWGLALVIYLGWSFLTNGWGITWVVWPIAGVSYGLLSAIVGAFSKKD